MTMFYLSPVQYFKERQFDVWVPAFYFPMIPQGMLDASPKPLEKPNPFKAVSTVRHQKQYMRPLIDPGQMQKALFTPEILLDMFRKKIDFEFVNDDDVVDLFENVDRYLMSIKADVELGDERIIEYAKLVISFREQLYHLYYRYMKLNPAAFEKLYPNNDPKNNLMYLMMHGGGASVDKIELDPLLAKGKPPYMVETLHPNANGTIGSGEVMVENYLGPSSSIDIKDDGSDFDFHDFLKKT